MPFSMYLRKSRSDAEAELRGEGETLARHERALMELAAQMGITIAESAIYREIVSGETIAARPMMQRLLQEVEAGLWEGVFVVEIERLARGDSIDQGIVAQAFKYSGTRIITPYKTYDPHDTTDETFMEFGLFMARQEYKAITRRLQAGRIASVKEGHYLGTRIPYGYERLVDKNGKGYSLKIEPDTATIVRSIFEWYAAGIGVTTIARRLNEMGLRSSLGKAWENSSIQFMLQNPTYIGMVRWNTRKTQITVTDGARVKSRPRSA